MNYAICTSLMGVGGMLLVNSIQADEEKPNIIYILADDAGIGDFGCYGQTKIKTPNIDRMAAEGMKFTNHYSGAASCAPSRCTLMTGLHTGHSRVRSNGRASLKPEDVTVGEVLRSAGYTTGCVGKWSLGEEDTLGAPWKQGFDFYYGFLNQARAHRFYPEYIWKNSEKVIFPNNPEERNTYIHYEFIKESVNFIKQNRDKPFFLYLALTLPHADLDVPEEYMKPYIGKLGQEKPYKKAYYHAQDKPLAAYAGMISLLDKDVGTILNLLKGLKLDKKTIVMFSSDNGVHHEAGHRPELLNCTAGLRGIKREVYDGGIHSPHIVWWPGKIKAGSTSNHISAFWDFLPTAAELAGATVPVSVDGISYVSELLGKEQKQHSHLYWNLSEHGGQHAVRKGKWKAVRLKTRKNSNSPLQLYNLETDFAEAKDIAASHPEIVSELATLMKESLTEQPKMNKKKNKKKTNKD